MIREAVLELYLENVPDARLKPKSHYLTHYPSQILELGPPLDHNTIRYEAKHNFFKEIYYRTKNTINIVKTLATQHQFYMYLTYRKADITSDDSVTTTFGKELPLILLDRYIQEEVGRKGSTSVVYQAQSVIYEGQKYSHGGAVVLSYTHDTFNFAKIESIIFVFDTPLLVCNRLDTIGFNFHLNCYEVMETKDNFVCKIEDLADFHPLGIYNSCSCKFSLIAMKHYLFQH